MFSLKQISGFFSEVRQEMRRIVWPTKQETKITTIVVFILAIIFAIYFMIVDGIIYRLIKLIIGQ